MSIPSLDGLSGGGGGQIPVDPGAMQYRDRMSVMNPQWSRWFDAIKAATAGKTASFGMGSKGNPSSLMTDLDTSPNGMANYGQSLDHADPQPWSLDTNAMANKAFAALTPKRPWSLG